MSLQPDPTLVKVLQRGFHLDGRIVDWGTLRGVARALPGLMPTTISAGWHDGIAFRSGEVFGIRTLSAFLRGPADDRPVLSTVYEVDAADIDGAQIVDVLAMQLGLPKKHEAHEWSDSGHAWSTVVETAGWNFGDVSIGLSVYGGERDEVGGRSIAMLWHAWDETIAAKPFIAQWQSQCEVLARYAARRSTFEAFTLDLPQSSLFAPDSKKPTVRQIADAHQRRAVHFSLHDRDMLATPPEIAAMIPTNGCALWTSAVDSIWCLSNRWDSKAFDIGAQVKVSHAEIKPAKGGGYCEVSTEHWRAHACYPSRTIADLAGKIAAIPGVTIEHFEGYDA
ncbi:MAG TPA: hypothetical protein VMF90_15405 [Rhizobiaceae bacterium]|nr:hypothetical protein [Rhizobiaceae bacterium]